MECTSCCKMLAINYFSNTQIKKGEKKRCVICVEKDLVNCLKCSSCKNLVDENQFTSTQIRKGMRRRCLMCVERDRWSRSSYDERKPYKCSGCRCWWSVDDYSGNQLKKGKKRRCVECVSKKKSWICLSCGDSYSYEDSDDDRVCKFCHSSVSYDSDPDVEDFYLSCISCEKVFLMSELGDLADSKPSQRKCQDCTTWNTAKIGDLITDTGMYRKINYITLPPKLFSEFNPEKQVSKHFKSNIYVDEYFKTVLPKLEKVNEIAATWNESYITKEIKVNHAEIWQDEKNGFIALVEPFLEEFQKFNSNTGWTNQECISKESQEWSNVMQSLSHFSYHTTQGRYLLCDLQGRIGKDTIVLSDPSISSYKKSFGPTDLACKGMETFFSNHTCSSYCEQDWIKPKIKQIHYLTTKHTTMHMQSLNLSWK